MRGTDLAQGVASDRDVADRVAGLQNAIKVVAQQNNLFEITTTAASPKLAAAITQKLIDIFVKTNLSDDRRQASQTIQFLDGQLEGLGRKLQDAEAKRTDFQNRYLGSLPGTGTVSGSHRRLAQPDEPGRRRPRRRVLQPRGGAGADGGRSAVDRGGGIAPGMGPARRRLAAIQGQLADARGRGYTDNHPDVIALKQQLAMAQGAASREPMTGGGGAGVDNPADLSLQAMLADKQSAVAALQMRKRQLQGDLDTLNAKLAGDPAVAAEQGEIDRNYTVLKDQYDQLLSQREQVNCGRRRRRRPMR
ncbi:hypothetical protein AB5I41_15925 [Sphingomonas sp. MMS24-JH45]